MQNQADANINKVDTKTGKKVVRTQTIITRNNLGDGNSNIAI